MYVIQCYSGYVVVVVVVTRPEIFRLEISRPVAVHRGTPSRRAQLTDDFEPIVGHQSHQRSTAVALTRIFRSRLVAGAHHVLRDQTVRVIGRAALLVADDRHVHVSQVTRRFPVLVQRAPSGSFSEAARVRVACAPTTTCKINTIITDR